MAASCYWLNSRDQLSHCYEWALVVCQGFASCHCCIAVLPDSNCCISLPSSISLHDRVLIPLLLLLRLLQALAKYAFGMGSLQVILSTLLFTAVALPAGFGLGTWFLEHVCGAPPSLVSIRTVDEAVVIAAALSMSSSAFVLQLLSERGEAPTRVGSATLGILLFQDIAVVPFLVLLPLIESNGGMEGASADTLLQMLGPTALTSVAGLAALLVGGRTVLRRIFEMVAESRSNEAFVALCLLTVGGSSLLTKQLGLSDTLGAFIAGVLLAETSFRTQVEADIRPFRGLLIGLFFMSVGGSINMGVLRENYDVILWMLAGLVSLKAAVNTALGPLFGLSKSESIRTGFLLSQGGEFAFVLLSLACQLKLLPEELNQILIITVVFSMALTPALAEVGSKLAEVVEQMDESALAAAAHTDNGQLPLVLEVRLEGRQQASTMYYSLDLGAVVCTHGNLMGHGLSAVDVRPYICSC
eukprot:GHRR01033383.1.p1 GENE.GHRR01033383.1~~GHRR01033383.1.p1  ORF type:complete len:471 (+),score=170.75 GHRR01033383.1:295-1707(+)